MKAFPPSTRSIPNRETLGVILAGGRSRRMGRDKATISLDGRSLLEWVSAALSEVVSEVMVVGRAEAGDIPASPDALPGHRGPSAGIATGLAEARGRSILVVGVDQPWVRPGTLAALLDVHPRPATPLDERLQVTCATYPPRSRDPMEETARRQRSLQTTIPLLGGSVITPRQWRPWGEDGRSWFSVDTPEDLEEGLRRYGVPGASS